MKKLLICLPLFFVVACQQDNTNVATDETIKQAEDAKIKAIDNDPSMTPEQKQKQKEMMGLIPGKGRAAMQGR